MPFIFVLRRFQGFSSCKITKYFQYKKTFRAKKFIFLRIISFESILK